MVTVKWHGHACFEIISSKGIRVVIDPHDGRSLGIKPPDAQADIVLITHEHFDHNAFSVVAKPSAQVFSMYEGSTRVNDIEILGIRTYHDRERGKRRGQNVIYRMLVDNVTFLHLGDLGHELDESYARKLGHIDIVMIPVGGTFTIDSSGAWKTIEVIKPKAVIPMHYWIRGLNLPLRPVDDFISKRPSMWSVVKLDSNILTIDPKKIESNIIYIFNAP